MLFLVGWASFARPLYFRASKMLTLQDSSVNSAAPEVITILSMQLLHYLVVCQPKIAKFGLGKGDWGWGKELKPFPFSPYPLPRQVSFANY